MLTTKISWHILQLFEKVFLLSKINLRPSKTSLYVSIFRNIHMKTTVLESLFNKVAGLQACNKETPTQVFSCEYCEIFKNTYFEERLRTSVSEVF